MNGSVYKFQYFNWLSANVFYLNSFSVHVFLVCEILLKSPVLTSPHDSAGGKETNHWAAGPLKTDPIYVFLLESYAI